MSGQQLGAPKSVESSDDFAEDIVGGVEYKFSMPTEKEFWPWHRPRKQFVRHDQWSYYIGQLLDETKPTDGTLKYFGLPGADLLDIRYFGTSVCEPRDVKLRFLGFNNGGDSKDKEQTEANISFDELSKAEYFDPQSEIVWDDLCKLVNDDSLAWQKTLGLGPYDVVNWDLCDGIGKQAVGKLDENYYNAMSKLLSVQARRKMPWLLFLTTRVGKQHVHTTTLNRLSALYGKNLKSCAPFQDASTKRFKIGDDAALSSATNTDAGLQSVFLVGICKWLLSLVINQAPPSRMEVKGVHGYRVNKGATVEDMVSIAIRFEPTHGPLKDVNELASMKQTNIDECELATKVLGKINGLLNVDDFLSEQPDIESEMISAMCTLLTSARYDEAKYREWLAVQ